jgi:O-methyltransferase involved in polyketide biosynthesis
MIMIADQFFLSNAAHARTTVLPIADTSALVLLWCGDEIYESRAVKDYFRMLDLRAGRQLYERCNRIWSDYGNVIRYRKLCILKEAVSILEKNQCFQVVIAGAGFSMLGLELASRFEDLSVFELDIEQMEEKARLVSALPLAPRSSLHCIIADIENATACADILSKAGWKSQSPALLVVEGLSYYISRDALRAQWDMLAPTSSIILEYLVSFERVVEGRRHISGQVFRAIMDYCGRDGADLTFWSEDFFAKEINVRQERSYTLSDIEHTVGSGRRLFRTREDGWIEVALLTRMDNQKK